MSPILNSTLAEILQISAMQRRQQTLRYQRQSTTLQDPPPQPYISSTCATPAFHPSPHFSPALHFDPSTMTITINTGPRIHGSNNRIVLPPPSSRSTPVSPTTDTTTPPCSSTPAPYSPTTTTAPSEARLLALLLATTLRLNTTATTTAIPQHNTDNNTRRAGERCVPPVSQPQIRLNVLVNSGLTVVGSGNVVRYAAGGKAREASDKGMLVGLGGGGGGGEGRGGGGGVGKRKRERKGEGGRNSEEEIQEVAIETREEGSGGKRVKREDI